MEKQKLLESKILIPDIRSEYEQREALLSELKERIESLGGQRLVLALDDFQVLKNPDIFKLLEELLDNTDHRFLLIAATQGVVPDSFTKYFMRHQGTMIGAACLSFRKAEIPSILNRMLFGEDAERYTDMVWENTEGWPAGVMLTALYLRRFCGGDMEIQRFPLGFSFAEELEKHMYEKIAAFYQKKQDESDTTGYHVLAEHTSYNVKQPLLQVSCFGTFRVVLLKSGKEISWRTRKAMELFAYLVDLEGKPAERRELLEHLWPDNAPNNEVAMLHNMIYSIRKELSSQPELKHLIQYKGHRYYLDRSLISVDLASKKQICRLAETGRISELYDRREELLSPWGTYLREVDGTWCMARRTYFERAYVKACSLLADYCRERRDFETEASCWNACIAADRYSEDAVAGLLRCYANMGERCQMQRVFKTAEKIFEEELGIELCPETVRIYQNGLKNRRN